jgi:hypothetical protein
MHFVFHLVEKSDDRASSFVHLRQKLVSEFPSLRTVERRRFVMTAPLAKMVVDERKCTTIRYNPQAVEYPAQAILPLFVISHGRDHDDVVCWGALRILSVGYKPVAQLDDDDARKDGFATKQELLDTLQQFYGKMTPTDLICIYTFELGDYDDCANVQLPLREKQAVTG